MDRRDFLHGLVKPLIAAGAASGATGVNSVFARGRHPSHLPADEASIPNKRVETSRSVRTGFPDLDWHVGELRDGMLVAIAGRPSMGKTSLALAIAAHVAVGLHRPVAIIGAPLSRLEILARLISFLARIDLSRVQSLLDQADMGPAAPAARALALAPLVIDDHPFLTKKDVAHIVGSNVPPGMRNGLTVVLAPELLEVDGKGHRHSRGRATLAKALHELGETYGGTVLCELPLGRGTERREDHWPRLTDLEGFSREFVRDADAVLLIHRPVVYDPSAEPELACVITALNRYGRCGATSLAFECNGGFANYRWHGNAAQL